MRFDIIMKFFFPFFFCSREYILYSSDAIIYCTDKGNINLCVHVSYRFAAAAVAVRLMHMD